MKSLKQRMLNDIESTRGMATKMAKLAGYATANKFTTMLKKEDGDIEKFDGFVRVVHEMYPEEKFTYMEEFAKTLNPNRITARFMLEYLTLYKLKDARDELISKMENCSNDDSREWAFVYGIDIKLANKQISIIEATHQLSSRNYFTEEMRIYSQIVKFYAFYDLKNVEMMNDIYNNIEDRIKKINNDFIRNDYMARLVLMEFAVRLHNNTLAAIREKIFTIDYALDPIKAYAYLQLGNSYMLVNYEKAKSFFERSYEYGTDISKKETRMSMNFIAILWSKFEDYVADGDKSNELFLYAKQQNEIEARKILNEINFDKLNNNQKAFNFYYQGLLLDDCNLFYKSIEYFNKSSDKFYKQLPIVELEKQGVNKYILNALSA